MLYPAELIRQATIANGHLSEDLICQLLPEQHDRKRSEEPLRILLKNLPNAEEQAKILQKLDELASMHNAKVCQFEWWDIQVDCLHVLCAEVHRDGQTIPVRFMWKRVQKGATISPDLTESQRPSIAPFSQAAIGYVVEFERTYYREMLEMFIAWLQEPFPLPTQLTDTTPSH